MKKTVLLIAIVISTLFSGCSKDDDGQANNTNKVYKNLIGKWYFGDPEEYGYSMNNSFTFTSKGNVTYSYWTGGQGNDFDSETGTFSVDGDILTMIYPEKVEIIFVQKVVFVNEGKMEFLPTGNADEEAYDGEYFKAN